MKTNCPLRQTAQLLLAVLGSSVAASAQSMRVSLPLRPHPGASGSDVTSFQLTPDGNEVLYWAALEGAGFGLHAAPVAGGPSRDLPGTLGLSVAPVGGRYAYSTVLGGPDFYVVQVESAPLDGSTPPLTLFERSVFFTAAFPAGCIVSPDGQHVAIVQDDGLLGVPIDASAPAVELGPTISAPTFTADSRRVVHLTHGELHSIPIDGSQPSVRLGHSLAGQVRSFSLTPDSTRVVYLSDQNIADRVELFVRAVDGSGASLKLNTTPLIGGNVTAFRISPDGTWVAFVADSLFNGRYELFRTPLDGSSAPIVLSGALVAGGDVQTDLSIDCSGAFVFYRADQEVNGRFELYAASASGATAPLKLSGSLASGGNVTSFLAPAAGLRILYRADQDVDGRFQLYSVPRDASAAPLALAGPLAAAADVEEGYLASPGGTHALFRLDRESDDQLQLFARRMDGSDALNAIGGALVAGGDVQADFVISRAAMRIVFRADADTNERFELFSTRLADAPVRLNAPLEPETITADVADFRAAGNGRVLYRADRRLNDAFELHSAALDAADDVELNAPLLVDQDVFSDHQITRDLTWTVFQSNQSGDTRLYSTRTDGSPPSIALATARQNSGFAFLPSWNSRYVVYTTDADVADRRELYVVAVDGGSSPLKLNPPLASGQFVKRFLVGAGDRVAFTIGSSGTNDMPWSAPLDGSTPARELAPARPAGRTISSLWISPDGGHVLYLANHDSPTTVELYSVPIDGSQAPVRLNSPLVAGGNVGVPTQLDRGIKISPNSSRVVFVADQDVDELRELYTAPLDGSAPSVELVSLSGASDVSDFQITPDSRHVLYRADTLVNEKVELFLVPIDGSGPSVKLNGPLIALGDVTGYFVTPDSQRVVYVADQEVDQVRALYSLTLAGGAPLRISDAATDVLHSARLSPDGEWVAYHRTELGVQDLLLVPSDGSQPARVVTPGLGGGKTISSFIFTEDSRRLLYLADQESVGVAELFQCIVGRPVRRR